jgi:ribose-phosphate pyrophosphokinase
MIYLNGEPVNVTLFPDNTSQVWKLDENHFNQERATIRWEFSHEGEFIQLVQLKHLLDRSIIRIYLQLSYLPYGRQDKEVSNDATFALHSFSRMINQLYFAEVFIMDPHSKEALRLINRSQAIYPHGPLQQALYAVDSDMIVYPDHGALTKYANIYAPHLPYIYGEKVRDQATGYISSYKLVGDCQGNKVMIVDDICDGGKTFEILAKDLHDAGALEVNLFVTHGLFTKGLQPLKRARINRIFTNKGEAVATSCDGLLGFREIR